MPHCPKCLNKLSKRSDKAYHCRRHGWVRNVQPQHEATLWDGKDRDVSVSIYKPRIQATLMESK